MDRCDGTAGHDDGEGCDGSGFEVLGLLGPCKLASMAENNRGLASDRHANLQFCRVSP